MKLVVGLGNPGDRYSASRHNIGFMTVDRLAHRYNETVDLKKKKSMTGKIRIGDEKVVLLKPQTFMNLSGEAVLYMASFLRVLPKNIIVVYDDMNLDLGRIRVRRWGSSGGHNGILSLIEFLKSDNFPRVRLGIGRPSEGIKVENWVLGKFSPEELEVIDKSIDDACDIIEMIVQGQVEEAMNEYNG